MQYMEVEWRSVTWYSKALAMAFFVALPFLGFWLGVRYEQAVGPRAVIVRPGGASDATTTTDGSQGSSFATSTIINRPTTIVSAQNVAVAGGREFSLKGIPDATFVIRSVARLRGALPVAVCGAGAFVYLPNPNAPNGVGTCIPGEKLLISGRPAELVVVDFEVRNESNAYVNSRFLQVFYNPETGNDIEGKLASALPALDAYGALPRSNRRTSVGFLVPEGQRQIQLVYGDYGKAAGLGESLEILLGKSVNGFIVDFPGRSIVDIPG